MPRQGFVEPATFARIASHLPSALDTVAQFAYTSGWRKNEVLTLAWTDVDRTRGLITLKIEHSKTKEPRTLPIPAGSALASLTEARWQARTITQPDGTTQLATLVFHRDGKPIHRDFRRAWRTARIAAGVPGLHFHDFRRSAVRNLTRSGVPETVAMKFTGHRSRAIFNRYNITDEADQRQALTAVEAYMRRDLAESSSNVVPLTPKKKTASA
jgi:integrase